MTKIAKQSSAVQSGTWGKSKVHLSRNLKKKSLIDFSIIIFSRTFCKQHGDGGSVLNIFISFFTFTSKQIIKSSLLVIGLWIFKGNIDFLNLFCLYSSH